MKSHRLERQDSFAIDTRVTNIDIVIGRGKAAAGANAHCRVIAGVAKERITPISRVVAAGGFVQERLITAGRVADPLSWFSESGFIGVYPVAIILSWIGTN